MAFHNVPPNGFPDLPDMEEVEAVVKDVATLKNELSEVKSGLTTKDAPSNHDFNTFTTDGMRVWVNPTWTNGPGSGSNGILTVYAYSGYVVQMLLAIDGVMRFRGYNTATSTWSPWKTVTTT